ncbi:RMD1 family protein [Clostridium sp. 19966]|uniref:RMD1 family protein n=1 Tax=Clostridium sp. 19966 TaxID=2768166 RepID=UPI0028E08EE0|nr:RMD1 family protein [Clostridium sp. 19966]MDT8719030.1 RMD1 family protein [Clostridium sp. 19966]
METRQFKAMVLSNEINLNNIALHFGINKKFKWEDALLLSESYLKGIIREVDEKSVYIYSFGALVFINMEYHEIQDIINYIKNIDENLKNNMPTPYMDEYKLEVSPEYEYMLYNDIMTCNELKPYYQDILALILSKSTSLRKIETDIDKLLDSIEDIIKYLESGKFNMSDEQIAKTSAKILRFKYNTISYLMLLDKPRSAWNNEDIESFYMEMVSLFEINERYEKLKHKTDMLEDITEVFSSLTHEKRGTRLEIMVIILILFELLISIIEFTFKFK